MAEEILRHNLDRVYDPGPDFPDPRLLSRTIVALRNQALRAQPAVRSRSGQANWRLSPRTAQLVGIITLLALVLATAGGFLAIYQALHRTVPVRTHPSSATATCSHGFHMYDNKSGWQDAGSRTTDGGVTWKVNPIPVLSDGAKGGNAECMLDPIHAWVTVATGSKALSPDHIVVFATTDGGQTWQRRGSVPAAGTPLGAALEFINNQTGWLLVDGGTQTLYSTVDGGMTWLALPPNPTLDSRGVGCGVNGMTFVSADRGWITWACPQSPGQADASTPGVLVASTHDGGKSWSQVDLRSVPTGLGWACGASGPIFTGVAGVLVASCVNAGAPWTGVYRTSDMGDHWALGSAPQNGAQSVDIDFVDARLGFAFTNPGGSDQSDLYKTTDSGQHWALVKKSVFAGQSVDRFQFVTAKAGFASTSTSGDQLWTTTDGGITWSLPGHKVLSGNVGCPSPPSPDASTAPIPMLMTTAGTGWAAGALHTTDGGQHWVDSGPPSVPNRSGGYAEFFLDPKHAWAAEAAGSATACADHVVILATADGGSTWTTAGSISIQVSSPSDSIWPPAPSSASSTALTVGYAPRMYFVDPLHGWLQTTVCRQDECFMGPRAVSLYRTVDGGATWTLMPPATTPTGCGFNFGISFSSISAGWSPLGSCSASDPLSVMVTHDGGATWTQQSILPGCGCGGGLPFFFDQQHGLLLQVAPGAYLLATADGGETWLSRSLPPLGTADGVAAISFASPSRGWILVSSGDTTTVRYRLYRTVDGGQSWSVVNPAPVPPATIGTGVNLTSLYFADSSTGFLADGPVLYKTADAGRTWAKVFGPIS